MPQHQHVLLIVTGSAGTGKSMSMKTFVSMFNRLNEDGHAVSFDRDQATEQLKQEKNNLSSSDFNGELSEEAKKAIYERLLKYALATFKQHTGYSCVVGLEGNWGIRLSSDLFSKYLPQFQKMNVVIRIIQFKVPNLELQYQRIVQRNLSRDKEIIDNPAEFYRYRVNRFREEENAIAIMKRDHSILRSVIDNSLDIRSLPTIQDQNLAYSHLYSLIYNIAFTDAECHSPKFFIPAAMSRSTSTESFKSITSLVDRGISESPNLMLLQHAVMVARKRTPRTLLEVGEDGAQIRKRFSPDIRKVALEAIDQTEKEAQDSRASPAIRVNA